MSTEPTEPDLSAVVPKTYSVERELTGGGMSRVFLARDGKLGRQVVIKMLTPELSATISADRFQREISVAARLRHPHIVPLLDAGSNDGTLYYTMPYIAGESLRERLRRGGPVPMGDAVRLALNVADALAYAHAQGIVHRDIKPENILLDSEHAVIADFGIARALSHSETHALTRTGVAVGTPAYMSPEQFTNLEVDGRSDIYSLGCVLFEMLTGRTAASAGAVGAATASASIPPAVKEVVRRAMAENRDERFATAAEFSEALRAASGGKSQLSMPASRRVAAYAAGIVVVVALAGFWAFWPHGARLEPNPRGQPFLFVNYVDVPLRDVIRDLGPKVKYNFIASKRAEDVRITAKVDSVPWDASLMKMLTASGLVGEEDSTGIISIRTQAEVDSILPKLTNNFVVCWRSARVLAEMIRPRVPNRALTVDTQMNEISITASQDELRQVNAFIRAVDVRTPTSKPLSPAENCQRQARETPKRGR